MKRSTLLPIQGSNNKPIRSPRALPWAIGRLALRAAILAICLSSCSPVVHKKISKPLTPKEESVEVAVFERNEIVPDNAEVIGEISIRDAGFTTNCGWETILEKAKTEVRAAGGNGLEILQHAYPNPWVSPCHQIHANILNISDDIKPVELSEKAREYFHDYVILKESDTTQCKIINETKDYLVFIYERQGTSRRAVLPKGSILAYHIDDPVALAEFQHEQTKKKFNVRFGLEGGYAYRTAKFADGLSSDYKDYLKKLTRGPVLGANVRFNISNMYSIGIHYDRFMSSNAGYFYAYDDNGTYYEGLVSDDYTINFIAASFGYHLFSRNQKHRFFLEYLLGYMNYLNKGMEFGASCTIEGATLGMGVVIDYDYMLSKHVAIGAGISYYNGTLSTIKYNGQIQNLGNNKEGLQRFNLKAGVRYYF